MGVKSYTIVDEVTGISVDFKCVGLNYFLVLNDNDADVSPHCCLTSLGKWELKEVHKSFLMRHTHLKDVRTKHFFRTANPSPVVLLDGDYVIRPKEVYAEYCDHKEFKPLLDAYKRLFARVEKQLKAELNFKFVTKVDGSESIEYDSVEENEETPALIG